MAFGKDVDEETFLHLLLICTWDVHRIGLLGAMVMGFGDFVKERLNHAIANTKWCTSFKISTILNLTILGCKYH